MIKSFNSEQTINQIISTNKIWKQFIQAKKRQILYLLCDHNEITKKVYNNLIKSLSHNNKRT